MVRVKICGITSPADGQMAARHGAHAIGLVFYEPSPRCVDVEAARLIAQSLPPWIGRVGVFVDADPDRIHRVVMDTGLSAVQLHGSESPDYARQLDLGIPVIKAITVQEGWQEQLRLFRDHWVLLDSAGPERPGGTGRAWDWDQFDSSLRPGYLILAGGLTPANVGQAIERIHPEAVDVSSGVERTPGIKDEQKVKAFMTAVHPHGHADRGED